MVAVAPPDTRGKAHDVRIFRGGWRPITQAQIYARVSGYLKDWKADIGTPVKAGQLLAEIDAPDLDQQIMQAKADLASAQANSTLADATLERGQSLITSGVGVEAGPRSESRPTLPTSRDWSSRCAGQSRPAARA